MAQSEWRVELALFSDSFRSTVAGLVEELGGTVSAANPGDDRRAAGADVVLLLAGGAESEALDFLADSGSTGARYMIGAAADHRIAAAALQSGARDYFALPDDLDLLRRCLERLAREAASRIEAGRFADAERRATGFEAIIGSSPALRQTLDQAARVAALRDLTVLIGGETGTGKELLARALHYGSPRAGDPFVEVNCAAIPANLLESELFGHERGAFTGAVAAKPGLFEIAHGGTLFLDEIGTLPLELQPKLLRALETRSIRRVGGQQSRQMDVRVVAASHVDLGQAVRQGEFREDLYYRLNVVTLVLPPLREREGDVELLARTFVERIATSYGLPGPGAEPGDPHRAPDASLARQRAGAEKRAGASRGSVTARRAEAGPAGGCARTGRDPGGSPSVPRAARGGGAHRRPGDARPHRWQQERGRSTAGNLPAEAAAAAGWKPGGVNRCRCAD